MGNRWYTGVVLLFWLASMSWLVVAKVLPPLVGGQRPDYRATLAEAPKSPPPVVWRVLWDEEAIGFAATRVRPAPGGRAEMRSLVRFEQLDVKKVLKQMLGALSVLLPSLGGEDLRLEMTVASRLHFDSQQALETLETSIAVAEMPHVLNLRGEVRDGNVLDVLVFSGDAYRSNPQEQANVLLRRQLQLPRDALVGDPFTPSSDLRNLEVGQTWTMPVYRPFPPNSPVQIIEAKAERLELIYWDRDPVEVMVVAYRSDAGSGLAATREPIGRVWVRPDGVVVRQEMLVSNLHLVFERMTEEQAAEHVAWLEDERFLPLLPGAEP
ncbi:MAG: hypothetical protein KY475_22475 [Planctomycetes bacterium]|nr:hypothetical protein [Planctomycetota bacterium]